MAWDPLGAQGVHVSEGPVSFASAASAPESPFGILYTQERGSHLLS